MANNQIKGCKNMKSIEKEIRQLEDKYYEYFPDGDFNEEMNKIQ